MRDAASSSIWSSRGRSLFTMGSGCGAAPLVSGGRVVPAGCRRPLRQAHAQHKRAHRIADKIRIVDVAAAFDQVAGGITHCSKQTVKQITKTGKSVRPSLASSMASEGNRKR